MAQKFSAQFKSRALGLVAERERVEEGESAWRSCQAVASSLGGMSPHTLYGWYKRSRIDAHEIDGPTTSELEELRWLRRENRELRRANEILKAASAFSQPSQAVPDRDDPLH